MEAKSPRSPSKRWITTTSSAMEDVASKIGEYDRGRMVQDLKNRKLANTKTSILFGNESVEYLSDAHAQQKTAKAGFDVAERKAQLERNKIMKADLTRANFSLGDEKVDYETTTKAGVRAAAEAELRCKTKPTVSIPAQKSSIDFGSEPPVYKSVAQEGMTYHGTTNDFAKMKSDVNALKTHLRRHQISMGDDKVDYTSDYRRGYRDMPADTYMQGDRKKELQKVINETRACHFSLGDDKNEYISNTHRAQQGASGSSPAEILASIEHAKKLKQQLQRTSFVVGFDPEYE